MVKNVYVIYNNLSRSSSSDDPVKEISGHSNKNEKAFREATNEEEDGDCSSAKVCRCEMCPDLSRDVSFTCCRNVSKAHSICIQENLSCICFAKNIEKLLDKASI